MELLMVQLPRGWTAVVGFDPVRKVVFTNHMGLFESLFQKGVKDFDGQVLIPRHGRSFLCAVYDYLFLNGYGVRLLHSTVVAGSLRWTR